MLDEIFHTSSIFRVIYVPILRFFIEKMHVFQRFFCKWLEKHAFYVNSKNLVDAIGLFSIYTRKPVFFIGFHIKN